MARVIFCTVAIGDRYVREFARMVQSFHEQSPGFELQGWVNVLPPGTPTIIEDGFDYTPYAAKPFALKAAFDAGANIAILLDSKMRPIRSIRPLVEHIARSGCYLCDNGYRVGEWSTGRCLKRFHWTRTLAEATEETSSYCVGLADRTLADRWALLSDAETIAGRHDVHRHDQTVLSILRAEGGTRWPLSQRPYLTAYAGHEGPDTVLVADGLAADERFEARVMQKEYGRK